MPETIHASPRTESRRGPLAVRSGDAELLDGDVLDAAELAANFRDIERVNRLLGGSRTVLRHLPRLLAACPSDRPVTVLDLATGSADIPLAILGWAKRRNLDLRVIASDSSVPVLDLARHRTRDQANITLERFDARYIPLPDNHVDIVLCSLSLHHLDPDDAVQVLGEMHRLGRAGFILNDLRRGRLGFAATWVAAHLTTRNRLTRHDAPLSVRRAYTLDELDELMRRAGIPGVAITTHPWFRMAAVSIKGSKGTANA